VCRHPLSASAPRQHPLSDLANRVLQFGRSLDLHGEYALFREAVDGLMGEDPPQPQ